MATAYRPLTAAHWHVNGECVGGFSIAASGALTPRGAMTFAAARRAPEDPAPF